MARDEDYRGHAPAESGYVNLANTGIAQSHISSIHGTQYLSERAIEYFCDNYSNVKKYILSINKVKPSMLFCDV